VKRLGLLAAAAVLLAGPLSSAAGARSLEMLSVEVVARVNPDGSMDVVERLQIDFDGDFNGGTREIPRGDDSIVGFEVTEDGDPRDLAPGFDDPNAGEVRWFGSADHEPITGEHTYELSYTVLDAADVFPDVGVLNWQFIGSGFPAIGRVEVEVTMPGDGRDLRAFAHGDLRGVVQPVGNTVVLRVFDNPEGSLVEARIVVPAAAFTVAPTGEPALEEILAEEGALAAEANAARQAAARSFADEVAAGPEPGCADGGSAHLDGQCERLDALLADAGDRTGEEELTLEDADVYFGILEARQAIRDEVDRIEAARRATALNVAAPVVAAVGAVAWFLSWRRWGKEPARPDDIGDYWREVPDESPAVVAAIDDWGVIGNAAFASTVIDLAQRGWLTVTEEPGGGHRFTRSQQATDELPLRDYESQVLWRLFAGGRATVSQDELVEEAKDDRTGSAAWMQKFKASIRRDYDAQQYQERNRPAPWLLHILIVVLVGGAAVLAFAFGAWVGAAVATLTAIVLLAMTGLLRRRTTKGARKQAEIAGLRAFLRDFSLVDDVPVGHLVLYERYLVYAVALGVADRLVAALRIRFPELADPGRGFATWYVASSAFDGNGGLDKLASLGTVGSFASDLSRATASAFSPPSSSSGGGGGFSGGGGGGGGGGSAGGW
jgi:uncharacterized membrane protein YgcG